MTDLSPRRPDTPPRHRGAFSPTHVSHARLRDAIGDRRDRLLQLELAMVAVCEDKAAHRAAPTVRITDRETWDRPTWTRYLAAAASVEDEFGPPMRQLLREIDQLERVMALPLTRGAAA